MIFNSKILEIKNELKSKEASMTNKVKQILHNIPETRNSDLLLYVEFVKSIGITLIDELIHLGISSESISRIRRRLQNEQGLYPASKNITHRRQMKEKMIVNRMRKDKKQAVG